MHAAAVAQRSHMMFDANLPQKVLGRARRAALEPVLHAGWIAVRNHALAALRNGGGILLLIGPPGTGKSMLLRELARLLEIDGCRAAVQVHADLVHLPLDASKSPRRSVLLVDEADRLEPELFSQLLARGADWLVLAGVAFSKEWTTSLPHGVLALALTPLRASEIAPFLAALNAEAGQSPHPITDEAVQRLAEHSGGVPRLLTRLAGSSAWLAAMEGSPSVTAAHVEEAALLQPGSGSWQPAPLPSSVPLDVPALEVASLSYQGGATCEPVSLPAGQPDAISAESSSGMSTEASLPPRLPRHSGALATLLLASVSTLMLSAVWVLKAPQLEAGDLGVRVEATMLATAGQAPHSRASTSSNETATQVPAGTNTASQPLNAAERGLSPAVSLPTPNGGVAFGPWEPPGPPASSALPDDPVSELTLAPPVASMDRSAPPDRPSAASALSMPELSPPMEPSNPLGTAAQPAGEEPFLSEGGLGGAPVPGLAADEIAAPPHLADGPNLSPRQAETSSSATNRSEAEQTELTPPQLKLPSVTAENASRGPELGELHSPSSIEAPPGALAALTTPVRPPSPTAGTGTLPSAQSRPALIAPRGGAVLQNQARPLARREASPLTVQAAERCRSIAFRFQLGEEPSNVDRDFLRNGCRSR